MKHSLILLYIGISILTSFPKYSWGKTWFGWGEAKSRKGLIEKPKMEEEPSCHSSKEFITTLEYLKSKPNLFPGNEKAIPLALSVASACEGAASRFIQAVEMLQKAQLTTYDILEKAKKLSSMSATQLETYIMVFKTSYASDGFDYDLNQSLELSERLSLQYKGPAEDILEEFKRTSQWCLDGKKIPLPAPACGNLVKRLILSMEKHKTPVSDLFEKAFDYLSEKKGGNLIVGEALQWSEELISFHPDSFNDFRTTFEYAKSEKGLALSRESALKLARNVALTKLPVASPSPP